MEHQCWRRKRLTLHFGTVDLYGIPKCVKNKNWRSQTQLEPDTGGVPMLEEPATLARGARLT